MSIHAPVSLDCAPPSWPLSPTGAGLRPRTGGRVAARRLRDWARGALPQACALCVARAGHALVCAECAARLPSQPAACPVCALPAAHALAMPAACGACLARPPPFAATVAAYAYAFPVDRLLQQLKYGGRLANADWAADALACAVARTVAADRGALPQRVVPLPLSVSRQRERGFNQAREIAARVARALDLPVASSLARTRAGPPQAALPWSARERNVRGAFAAAEDVLGAHLALVDDVMTTGATLAEAAATLRRAGAARVDCWVVARTPPPA